MKKIKEISLAVGLIFMVVILYVLGIVCLANAETSIKDYGYYHYNNEISAKDFLIGDVDNIFDFKNRSNVHGEKIEKGRYYVPITYKGLRDRNGKDEDYIYVDELLNKYNDTNIKKDISNNKTEINNNADNISINKSLINDNSNKINNLDNRVSDLEETQYIVGGKVRVHDSKKWSTHLFADYSTNRSKFDRVGVRFTYKFGKSYEEKRIDELERKLNQTLDKLK